MGDGRRDRLVVADVPAEDQPAAARLAADRGELHLLVIEVPDQPPDLVGREAGRRMSSTRYRPYSR